MNVTYNINEKTVLIFRKITPGGVIWRGTNHPVPKYSDRLNIIILNQSSSFVSVESDTCIQVILDWNDQLHVSYLRSSRAERESKETRNARGRKNTGEAQEERMMYVWSVVLWLRGAMVSWCRNAIYKNKK